ncbi:MAG: hypothetical protein GVY30_11635 [Chloroflexi bacterium]|jgi:hypothetical protein|nr:hypothetical protein [Chloroflexota bacterium]
MFNRNRSPYYVVQEAMRWNIYQKTVTGLKRLGMAENKASAEKIALALDVYDLAEKATDEMSGGSTSRSHREALVDRFVQVQALHKREARRLEMVSCSTQFSNLITLLLGITTIALLTLLLRYLFGA